MFVHTVIMVIEPHMKQGRQHKLISTIFLATSVTKKLDHNNLKHHCKVTYTNLLTSGRLNAYLADIDRQAQEGFERLIEGMKQAQGITAKGRKRLRMDRMPQ